MKKTLYVLFAALAVAATACSKPNEDGPLNNGEKPGNEQETASLTLALNEIDGAQKCLELYNYGDAEINLDGLRIYKDEFADEKTIKEDLEAAESVAIWKGSSKIKMAPKSWLVLWSYKSSVEGSQDNETLILNSGLSNKQAVKLVIVDATGAVVDEFVRGDETCVFGETVLPQQKAWTMCRIPDGTGEWAYAEPTTGAANGEKQGEIEHTPVE